MGEMDVDREKVKEREEGGREEEKGWMGGE